MTRSPAVAVALDVGGTGILGALVRPDGTVLHPRSEPCVRDGRRDSGLRTTAALAGELIDTAASDRLEVSGIGAGFPEYVSPDGLLTSREVLEWTRQPRDLLGALLPGRPAAIESDVRCGALAEAAFGAGRATGSFLYVSLGTGLSSAFVQDGRVVRGHRGEAIALGEFDVPAAVDPAFSGGRTSRPAATLAGYAAGANLESYASGAGIAHRYAAASGAHAAENPAPECPDPEPRAPESPAPEAPDPEPPMPEAREVARRAAAGDAAARGVLDSAGSALGVVLAQAVGLLDPESVVLGGGLGTADGVLHDALRAAYGRHTSSRPGAPPIRRAELGAYSGLIGAAHAVHAAPR